MSAEDEAALAALAAALGEALVGRGLMLATAESCTGGWVAEAVTAVAGSSTWFERGFVTYSNAAKTDLLGVPGAVLEAHGAVSAQTAVAMVEGVLARSPVDLAVSITGVAGPGGGSPAKPVGTVWFGFARRGSPPAVRCCRFPGGRREIRLRAVAFALAALLALAREEPLPEGRQMA